MINRVFHTGRDDFVGEDSLGKTSEKLKITFTVAFSPLFEKPTYVSMMPADKRQSDLIAKAKANVKKPENFAKVAELSRHFEKVQSTPGAQEKFRPVEHTPTELAINYLALKELQKLSPDDAPEDFDLY